LFVCFDPFAFPYLHNVESRSRERNGEPITKRRRATCIWTDGIWRTVSFGAVDTSSGPFSDVCDSAGSSLGRGFVAKLVARRTESPVSFWTCPVVGVARRFQRSRRLPYRSRGFVLEIGAPPGRGDCCSRAYFDDRDVQYGRARKRNRNVNARTTTRGQRRMRFLYRRQQDPPLKHA